VEKNSSKRDESAELLINSVIKKQSNAPYYMTQTILVQETVLNKLNKKVMELEKEILSLKNSGIEKESKNGFLSGFFKNKNKQDNNSSSILNSKKSTISPNYNGGSIPNESGSTNIGSSVASGGGGNSFLGNALQTAVGVAGGMVVGNMLTNLFQNKKSEDEVFTSINNDTYVSNIDNHPDVSDDHENNEDFIDEEDDIVNENPEISDISYSNPSEDFDSSFEDLNDDNFI
jgi:uncharacterized protein